MAKSTRTLKNTTAATRSFDAVRLRDEGMGFEEIGQALGISRQGATKAYDRGMATLEEETRDIARHRAAADARKLDRMEQGLLRDAYTGNPQAVQSVLKIMERRAKLFGMDAPTKSELTGKDGEALGSGVFAMPMRALTVEEWSAEAKALAANEESAADALVAGLPNAGQK